MKVLENLVLLGLGAGLVLITETVGAQRPADQAVSDSALTTPLRNTYGTVKSIAGRFLTLDVNGSDRTFIVGENTDVLARGASRATRKAGGNLPITDLVHTGDIVRVAYRELDGAMRASEIHIRGRNTIAAR